MSIQYRKSSHCVFSIQEYTYFVTVYPMVERLTKIGGNLLVKNDCILLDNRREKNYVHLLIN